MWKPSFEDVQVSRLVIHWVPLLEIWPPTLAIAGTISTTITSDGDDADHVDHRDGRTAAPSPSARAGS